MRPYYHTCPRCGANLDPCERCTCEKEEEPYSWQPPRRAQSNKFIHQKCNTAYRYNQANR